MAADRVSRRTVSGPRRERYVTEIVVLLGFLAAIVLSACTASFGSSAAAGASDDELRLGYFGNVTHGPALIGVREGYFQRELGDGGFSTQIFNSGPSAIEALNAGAIDAAYVGPSPALNSFAQSKGESLRIVAGAASGGAQLVVRPELDSAEDLRGRTVATPQLGGTQDVALRNWLADHGLTVTVGGGDVNINPMENAQTLGMFLDGRIDGAWVPEPWASRLVLEGGAKVLVDEADLWEDGRFPATVLVVNKSYLERNPKKVEGLVRGHVAAVDWLTRNGNRAAEAINGALADVVGKPLHRSVIDRSLKQLAFTTDPLRETYPELLDHGVRAGTTRDADVSGIVDTGLLDRVLDKMPDKILNRK